MSDSTNTMCFRFWLWLIRFIGLIVPRRLRADWRQEWEAELHHRESLLAQWEKLNWQTKLDCGGAASAHCGTRCGCNHEDWRTKCFKTCATARECC